MTFGTSKLDRGVERVSEVYKNGNFPHWNVPPREYVIDTSLPNKKGFRGLAANSRFSVGTSKLDRGVERVSEVYKNGNFPHWNVPPREYICHRYISSKQKGFQRANR